MQTKNIRLVSDRKCSLLKKHDERSDSNGVTKKGKNIEGCSFNNVINELVDARKGRSDGTCTVIHYLKHQRWPTNILTPGIIRAVKKTSTSAVPITPNERKEADFVKDILTHIRKNMKHLKRLHGDKRFKFESIETGKKRPVEDNKDIFRRVSSRLDEQTDDDEYEEMEDEPIAVSRKRRNLEPLTTRPNKISKLDVANFSIEKKRKLGETARDRARNVTRKMDNETDDEYEELVEKEEQPSRKRKQSKPLKTRPNKIAKYNTPN